jgi:phosphodiesterase/alkaline phosphatase D-like protein
MRTAPPLLPTVTSSAATAVSDHSATVGALINPGWGDTTYRVDYGVDRSYGTKTEVSPSIEADGSDHQVNVPLTGLAPGTTYHYRVIATNFSGATQGPDGTFTTQNLPRVDASTASSITTDSAVVMAQVDPNGSATSYRFEYGPASGFYGSVTPPAPLAAPDGVQAATAALHGLYPGTTYHFRVVASNEIGTSFGPDGSFTTGSPTSSPPPANCKRGFVKKRGKCVKRHRRHRRKKRVHSHG